MDPERETFISPATSVSGVSIAMSTLKGISPGDVLTVKEEEEHSISPSGEPELESRLPSSTNIEPHQSDVPIEITTTRESKLELEGKIIKAIKKGNNEAVQIWIEGVTTGGHKIDNFIDFRKETVTHRNYTISMERMTALHYAALYCQVQIVEILMKAGADPSITNASGENVLHVAVQTSHGDFVKPKDQTSDRNPPAVQVIEMLLERNSDFVDDVTEGPSWTALLMAVDQNLPDIVRVLLKYGADPGKVVDPINATRYSIVLAAKHKDGEVLKILTSSENLRKCDINKISSKFSALHQAVYCSHIDNVKLLIDKGAGIMVKDRTKRKRYPIHYACRSQSTSEFETIVDYLRKSLNAKDKDGKTLLHLAVEMKRLDLVQILVSKFYADFEITDNQGRLPIHYLVQKNLGSRDFEKMVGLLKNEKATNKSINVQDKDGLTPLHLAIMSGRSPECIKFLIDNEADTSIKADRQRGVFYFAIHAKTTDDDFRKTIELFLKKPKMNFNDQDADGKTMLHHAIEMKKFSKANIIVKLGRIIDPSFSDNEGRNCLHYAFIKRCDGELVGKLLERRVNHPKRSSSDLDNHKDKRGKKPSQYVSADSPLSAFKALKNAKVHPIGDYKRAFILKRYDIVKVLLVKGAKLDCSALMEVIKSENEDLVKILIRHAEDIETPLNSEFTLPYKIGDKAVNSRNSTENNKDGDQAPNAEEPTNHDDIATVESGDGAANAANCDTQKRTTPFRELIQWMPDAAIEALQRNVKVDTDNNRVEFSYSLITKTREGRNRSTALEDPLKLMVEYKRTEILQHPVIRSFLLQKWKKFGFYYYLFTMLTYGLFLFLLTAFSMISNNPLGDVCAPDQFQNESNSTGPDDSRNCGPFVRQVFTYLFAALLILLSLYHQMLEVCQIIFYGFEYIYQLQNYVEFFVYILSVTFVFVFFNDCGCPKEWQWQIGLLAMLMAWTNVIFFAFKFPAIGIFVLIFYKIVKTFLKVALFSLVLILGFSFILLMMFNNPDSQISSFLNIGHSFVKTATMVTGELDFEAIFGFDVPASDYVPIPFHEVTFFIWIIFIILIPIILNNMLTSLAVGDAREIMNEAELEQFTLQVKNILEAEGILESFPIRKYRLSLMNDGFDYIDPGVWGAKWRAVIFFIWGGKDYFKDIKDFKYEKKRMDEQKEMEVEAFDEVHNKPEDPITEKLNGLMCLVEANEEQAKKRQELLEKLAIHLNLQVE